MLIERNFSNLSRQKKPVDPEWEASVAEYLEEVGATDLDDPSAPKRKTPRTDAQLRKLDGFHRTQARNKAKPEHQAALAKLESGTAVLRQKSERTKPAKQVVPVKQLKIAKNTAKPAKEKVNVAKKPVKTINFSEKMTTKIGQEVLDQIKEKGFYQVSDFEMSRVYLGNIISDIRELGYKLVNVKVGRKITQYRLDEQ